VRVASEPLEYHRDFITKLCPQKYTYKTTGEHFPHTSGNFRWNRMQSRRKDRFPFHCMRNTRLIIYEEGIPFVWLCNRFVPNFFFSLSRQTDTQKRLNCDVRANLTPLSYSGETGRVNTKKGWIGVPGLMWGSCKQASVEQGGIWNQRWNSLTAFLVEVSGYKLKSSLTQVFVWFSTLIIRSTKCYSWIDSSFLVWRIF
jgi:hypothetical protein